MSKIEVHMVQEKQTHGAIKYTEVDSKGAPVKMQDGSIGSIYLRKTAFTSGAYPVNITVTVAPNG